MKYRRDGSNKGLKISEQKELERRVSRLMGKGYDDYEIMLKLDLQPHVLRTYKKRIADNLIFELKRKGPIGIFADVVQVSAQTIKELDEILEMMPSSGRNMTAATQAIQLKKSIHSYIINLGKELGLLSKRQRHVRIGEYQFSTPRKRRLKSLVA